MESPTTPLCICSVPELANWLTPTRRKLEAATGLKPTRMVPELDTWFTPPRKSKVVSAPAVSIWPALAKLSSPTLNSDVPPVMKTVPGALFSAPELGPVNWEKSTWPVIVPLLLTVTEPP